MDEHPKAFVEGRGAGTKYRWLAVAIICIKMLFLTD
jgi:hypothetical protein